MTSPQSALRIQFFDYLFRDNEGYVCIATRNSDNARSSFKEQFFDWPKQKNDLSSFLSTVSTRSNCWFCASLLTQPVRKKQNCIAGDLVWSDLDTCDPKIVDPPPTVLIESSPARYQALWRIDNVVDPVVQEDYSRRIAYRYNENGADPSGWDLTQLLRVPLTFNWKYKEHPEVILHHVLETPTPVEIFEALPAVSVPTGSENGSYPEGLPEELPDPYKVIYKYSGALTPEFVEIYEEDPPEDADWSDVLWKFLMLCVEAGMAKSETLSLASTAACNKYARDGRPIQHLWRDVLKAYAKHQEFNILLGETPSLVMPSIIDPDLRGRTTFIDLYQKWGEVSTDAVAEFHELSAFMLLSSVCAPALRLRTTYGPMVPNLWGLVLGDSTLTRKTTAMRMAIDLLYDLDPELVVATDGSPEGLLTGLSVRPNRASIFYRDEVAGFFDSINRKDFLSGMPETLAHLYDVPGVYTRRLRKETITVTSPVFIFFGGGIRDKVYSLITEEMVLSGFMPRFLVVSGDTDLKRIRRTGPAIDLYDELRNGIAERLKMLFSLYGGFENSGLGPAAGLEIPRTVVAEMTDRAWEAYGKIEETFDKAAYDSPVKMMALPTFGRLARSLLKMAMLLAAERQVPNETQAIEVDELDVIGAAHYIQKWGYYTCDLIKNTGKSASETRIQNIYNAIRMAPGAKRGVLMQHHRMNKREADLIFETLQERGLIAMQKEGRTQTYYPT